MNKIKDFIRSDTGKLAFGALFFISAIITDKLQLVYLPLILYITALLISGFGVYIGAVRGILRRDFLDEKFLMSIASIGAMIVGEYSE